MNNGPIKLGRPAENNVLSDSNEAQSRFLAQKRQQDAVLRERIVADKKDEMLRLLSDLEGQLTDLHLFTSQRFDEVRQQGQSEEQILQQLETLKQDLTVLKEHDAWEGGEELVKVNSDLEYIRRSLLVLQQRQDQAHAKVPVSQDGLDFSTVTAAQWFRAGLLFTAPLALAVLMGFVLLAVVLYGLL